MVAAILTTALPILFKLIGLYFDRYEPKVKNKKEWLKFLQKIEDNLGDSARLRHSVKSQRERIMETLKQEQDAE